VNTASRKLNTVTVLSLLESIRDSLNM